MLCRGRAVPCHALLCCAVQNYELDVVDLKLQHDGLHEVDEDEQRPWHHAIVVTIVLGERLRAPHRVGAITSGVASYSGGFS